MIDENLVEIVADLARLGISNEEKEKYTKQIAEIFKYFEELKMIDLSNIDPQTQIIGLKNSVRHDEVHLIFSENKTLAQAPEIEGEQIKVPGVMKGKK
jgi:aspartyl-tRNA(Asn)/glutamyl-tRNA(Gln) amidotransferase subunit C